VYVPPTPQPAIPLLAHLSQRRSGRVWLRCRVEGDEHYLQTERQYSAGDLTYEYDKAGNRTKIGGSFARTGLPQGITSTAYNAANHQTTFGDKTLTYDNNGNVQTITDGSGTTTYTWNARNQLVGISGPGVSATFVYDGLGRREKKTIKGNLTEFLFDRFNPVQETSGATILANILPGLGIDEFLTRTDVGSGVTSSFLPDALGSAVALADSSGTVQTEYAYEPFGRTTATGASSSNPYQFTGRENDGTGLYYYRARYYHPALQRFISEDPIEFHGGNINLYSYVSNDPLSNVDPHGLIPGLDEPLPPGCCDYRFPSPPPQKPKSEARPPKPTNPPFDPNNPCQGVQCRHPQDKCRAYNVWCQGGQPTTPPAPPAGAPNPAPEGWKWGDFFPDFLGNVFDTIWDLLNE
jgi:RHS repeat-associated protein